MRVVRVSERQSAGGAVLKLLARFGLVGIAATILYAALAAAFVKSERLQPRPGIPCRLRSRSLVFLSRAQVRNLHVARIA